MPEARDRLHVILAVDPEIPVPPTHYGGIERIAAALAEELVARGHRVTLAASPESTAPGELWSWPRKTTTIRGDVLRNAASFQALVRRCRAEDGSRVVIHNFARLANLAVPLLGGARCLQSYQREVTPRSARIGQVLGRGNLLFTACSAATIGAARAFGDWRVVYNCADFLAPPSADAPPPDAPLVFLGRVEPIKGPHTAIDVAQRTGRRLLIAGNIPEGHRAFAEAQVLGRCDGDRIRYVGPVDDTQKRALLAGALGLLFPIEWEEPFGIVMAEAMAAGAPVLAFRRGSTPEVVEPGVTGLLAGGVDEMVAQVASLQGMSRLRCYERGKARFARSVIVDHYEALYRELASRPSRS